FKHKLRLADVDARILGVRQAKTLTSDLGTTRANGMYVIFKLAVTNKLGVPTQFDGSRDQTGLIIGDMNFSEDLDAEDGQLEDSFLWQSHDIQPTKTQVGTVVFDVPLGPVKDLTKRGALAIINFRDTGVDADSVSDIGEVRLWK